MICSMFGHHDAPANLLTPLTAMLVHLTKEEHVDRFLIGNQGRFDLLARYVLNEIVIPGRPRVKYSVVLAYLPSVRPLEYPYRPDETIYPEGLEKVPKRFAISRRNRWMVDQSDIVLGYCRYSIGGTASILEYARKKKKRIIDLAEYVDQYVENSPDSLEFRAFRQDKSDSHRV
ncbi:MAG: hypothetical protein J6N32_06380 [Clostridia bacterium]|nr:hypothetical protein [Clostridia bacterium]MBP3293361.1 hypothetical protein [Clostridia bacterium]